MEWGIYTHDIKGQSKDHHMHRKLVILRLVGFLASLILTLASYLMVVHPEFFGSGINTALMVIFILALLQSIVQVIFFIDVWDERGLFWNLGVFISTVVLIVIIVGFSVWIMAHLDYNMMNMST